MIPGLVSAIPWDSLFLLVSFLNIFYSLPRALQRLRSARGVKYEVSPTTDVKSRPTSSILQIQQLTYLYTAYLLGRDWMSK